MKKITKKQARNISAVVGSVAFLLAVIFCPPNIQRDFLNSLAEVGIGLCCMFLYLSFPIVCGCFAYATLRLVNRDAVRTRLQLIANSISSRMQQKNAATVSRCLVSFLFDVLRQNDNTLLLPLGQDASCLIPRGFASQFRHGCLFYRFELVMPQAPEMDIAILRQIIQQHIDAELINYGIGGLNASFRHPTYGLMPSVYLDRMNYDKEAHLLQFALIYIASPETAQYACNARKRDTKKVEVEQEVFDDEL